MSTNSPPRPYFRPKSRQYRLSRALGSTKKTVAALDRSKESIVDNKVLLSLVLMNQTKQRQFRWALELQTMKGEYVNYLSMFFQQMEEHDKSLTTKFRNHFKNMGVAISPSSGHFDSLAHLDPAQPAPPQPVNIKVRNTPMLKFVDMFTHIEYDVSYRRFQGDGLSYFLQATYSDGVKVDIDWRLISDNWDPAPSHAMAYAYIGAGGRFYPLRMSRRTTPRLWNAKYQVAIKKIDESNLEFSNLVAISLAGVMSNLPVGPVANPTTAIGKTTSPARIRTRPSNTNYGRLNHRNAIENRGTNSRSIPNQEKVLQRQSSIKQSSEIAVVDSASASRAAVERKFAQAAAQHPDTIYHRFMYEGGVRDVATTSKLRAGSGTGMFGGGEQVRAWFGPAPNKTDAAVIEFTAITPGSARNTVGSKFFAYWSANDGVNLSPHLQGSDLKITIRRIIYADGSVARPIGGGRFRITEPGGSEYIINMSGLPDK